MRNIFSKKSKEPSPQAFISYSFDNKKIMNKLKKTLGSYGINCYVAEHDEDFGNFISNKLSKAIDDSDVVIVILTKEGSMSSSVNQEIGYAKKAGKPIIPLVDSGISIPVFLQGTEYIKFDESNLDKSCEKIARFFDKQLSEDLAYEEEDKGEFEEEDESFDETIILDEGEDQIYSYDLDEDDKIVGKIKSDQPINVFVVTNYGLRQYKNDDDFNYENGGERIKRIKINFKTYKVGSWHIIIANEESDKAEIDVYLNRE